MTVVFNMSRKVILDMFHNKQKSYICFNVSVHLHAYINQLLVNVFDNIEYSSQIPAQKYTFQPSWLIWITT